MSLRLSGGRRLRSPPGTTARPTAARVRLAVMNILSRRLPGCRWLDLCCGSGVMACEALRRGARQVVAVERDPRVAAVALANLRAVVAESASAAGGRPARVRVVRREVISWLRRKDPRDPEGSTSFDLIYLDPPYSAGLHAPVTTAVARGGWLAGGGLLIWECDRQAVPDPPAGWRLAGQRSYGRTELLFLEPVPDPDSERGAGISAPQGAAAAVLIPGGHEQTHQGDGDQAEHDAAEQRFDHGPQG